MRGTDPIKSTWVYPKLFLQRNFAMTLSWLAISYYLFPCYKGKNMRCLLYYFFIGVVYTTTDPPIILLG
jgi:hypothetical protein